MEKTWLQTNFLYIISLITVTGAFCFDFCILFVAIPAENQTIVNVLAGSINTGAMGVIINYFFSSSTGSADKSETIKQLINNKP